MSSNFSGRAVSLSSPAARAGRAPRRRTAEQVVLFGGITADRVLFVVLGTGATAFLDQNTRMNGTLLATARNISIGKGTVVNGGLFGGVTSISAGPSTLINRAGFIGDLP